MKGVSLSTKFFFLSSAFAIFFTTEAVIKIPGNETVSAVLMFGDSIVDTGNNNDLNTIAKCNFLPYGREFKGGMPTGRFSNGKVPSDFLVEDLGVKEFLPAYRDPTLQPKDFLTGVSFASGGAGYDHLTSTTASAISLSEQIQDFKKYIGKLKGMVGEERTNFILAKCVTFSVASSNDITNTYFISGIRKLNYDFPSYTDYLVESASNFVKELYGLGIRRIGVFSAPPLGCLPSQKTLNGYSGKGCVNYLNEASKLFNAKLSAEMGCLNNNLPHARVVYIDVYNPLLNIVQDPKKYGLEIANKGCCGTGIFEVSILCNQLDPGTCADDSKYVFFDSYHPTERTYKIIVSQLLQKYIKSFL
ncbi:GDSL esterase/lipase EXL3-like isoform X1 [Corylus avellana]|uniref:GDSL esterase/lipase EXL3-like isoform X1 n=1 Tax=Corylus avellana TaxID=13451 RepID=UPI00286C4107|nr:GDSL esterase/lipase EXL3-like isoform X1 [Corylus avellana]